MTYQEISNHRLEGAEQLETPNKSGNLLACRFVVMHYTAGPSLEGAIRTLTDPNSQASAHLIISPTGKIVQLVSFDKQAWHAGKSSWKPAKGAGSITGLQRINRYSIGIELVNAGPLRRSEKGLFYTWWGKQILPEEVIEVDTSEPGAFGKRWWHRFPEEQIWSSQLAVQAIRRTYPIEEILAHSDISPGRKTDPGPVYPLQHLRSIAEGRYVC